MPKEVEFDFTVTFHHKFTVPDDTDDRTIRDLIADVNIPESEGVEYVTDTFEIGDVTVNGEPFGDEVDED